MNMFAGTYKRKIDSKGRVSIPAEFRHLFNETIVYLASLDKKKTEIITSEQIHSLIKEESIKKTDLAKYQPTQIDAEGRIVLTNIKNQECRFLGCYDRFIIEFGL